MSKKTNYKKIFLFLLTMQNFTAFLVANSRPNPEDIGESQQNKKETDVSADALLQQHLASLDSQIGIFLAAGLMSGTVATFALVTKNKDIAKSLGFVAGLSLAGTLYYAQEKKSLIMQRYTMQK